MHRIQTPKFSHRRNQSLIHSYCSRCYANVAISMSQTDIKSKEKEHKCDPKLLALVEEYMRSRPRVVTIDAQRPGLIW